MVNFHDPVTFAREFAATVNLWHTMDGIFIWEYFSTLNYEWEVIRGRRPYRWTIWVYSVTRIASLMAIALNLLAFNDRTKINCQAWATLDVFFCYVSFGASSLLILLRIIAIWEMKRIIVLIASGIWLVDVGFLIYGTAEIRAVWSDESNSCVLTNPNSNRLNVVVSLVSDVLSLLIMVTGLLRKRIERDIGLGRILWNQSLIWLFLATIAEVPPTVFMFLNLNEALDLTFQAPNMVIMTIAATKMYRSLLNLETAELSEAVRRTWGGTISNIQFRSESQPANPLKWRTKRDQNSKSQSESGNGGPNSDTEVQTHTE